MHDLAVLATRLIKQFPEYYGFFAQREFEFDGRAPDNSRNRNPLLSLGIGADGLKTGHTNEAGYGLVGSAVEGQRRVVFVITGLSSEIERREEAEGVVSWAFRQFSLRKVLSAEQQLAISDVWLGAEPTVGLVAPEDYVMLIPALNRNEVSGEVNYHSPITAPIAKGQEIGELVITREGLPELRLPLVADRDVPKGGFVPRLQTAAQVFFRDVVREKLGFF